jgi:hypothetical protein
MGGRRPDVLGARVTAQRLSGGSEMIIGRCRHAWKRGEAFR